MFLILSVFTIFAIIYFFALLTVDTSKYFNYIKNLKLNDLNEKLNNFAVGNALGSLPNIIYNGQVDNESMHGTYLGLYPENNYKCPYNIVHITEQDQYFIDGVSLKVGFWCLKKVVKCNLSTGYVVAGINDGVCKSRYPNMFGGRMATDVIACNNEEYYSQSNILIDYKYGVPVSPFNVKMTSEDELLSNEQFRFSCNFSTDDKNNKFIPHPLNRFHPIQDPCKKRVFDANNLVRTNVTKSTWSCDCGNFKHTRVALEDPTNPKSTCSSCVKRFDETNKSIKLKQPYECATINSFYQKLVDHVPCVASKFSTRGGECDVIQLSLIKVEYESHHRITDTHGTFTTR